MTSASCRSTTHKEGQRLERKEKKPSRKPMDTHLAECLNPKRVFPVVFSHTAVISPGTTTRKRRNRGAWPRITKTWPKQRVAAVTNHHQQRSKHTYETNHS